MAQDRWQWQSGAASAGSVQDLARDGSDGEIEQIEAVAEENARLRAVLGHCPKPIAVLDEAGLLVGHNVEFGELFPKPPPMGEPVAHLFESPHRELLERVVASAGTTQRSSAVLGMAAPDGARKDLEFFIATLPPGRNGRSMGLVLAGDDETARVDEEVERLSLVRTIDGANADGAFDLALASLCHDVANALVSVTLAFDALASPTRAGETLGSQATMEIVRNGIDATSQAANILRRVRDRERLTLTNLTGASDVHECADRVLRLLRPIARRHAIDFVLDVPPSTIARMNASDLMQVLTNLIANAAHAIEDAKRPGKVRVSARRSETTPTMLAIHILDNGVGIAPSRLKACFEPYATSRADRGGTGLGLAISQRLVEAVGGKLRAVSEPDHGTELVVEMPAA